MTQIYTVWDKGRAAAPDAVRHCMATWEALNPDAELVVFDAEEMNAALPALGVDPDAIWIAARTDIFRTHILAERGGIWIDATLLATLPLARWLPDYLDPAGIFFLSDDARDRPLSSCFIATDRPGHPMLVQLRDELVAYWDRPRSLTAQTGRAAALLRPGPGGAHLKWQLGWRRDPHYTVSIQGRSAPYAPYFYWHYLIAWLDRERPGFLDLRRDMPWMGAGVMHSVQNMRRFLTPEAYAKAIPYLLRTCPVQKLDWRQNWPEKVFAPVPPDRVAY